MTLTQSIDKVVSWLSENVCSQITLKLPDDDRNDAEYAVEYVHPAAFPLYVPGKDRLPLRCPLRSLRCACNSWRGATTC